jgi:hypothetical protein
MAGRSDDSGLDGQEKRMPVMHRSEAMPHAGLTGRACKGQAGGASA